MESTDKIKSYPEGGHSGEKCLQGNNNNSDNNKAGQIFRISFEFLQGNALFFFLYLWNLFCQINYFFLYFCFGAENTIHCLMAECEEANSSSPLQGDDVKLSLSNREIIE